MPCASCGATSPMINFLQGTEVGLLCPGCREKLSKSELDITKLARDRSEKETKTPDPLRSSGDELDKLPTAPMGGGVAAALKLFGYLSIPGGLILALLAGVEANTAFIMILAGILYGVLLLGFAAIINLLRTLVGILKQ